MTREHGCILPNPVAVLEGITVTRSSRDILRDINLSIRRGEYWALLGPNGSGKTTLLNVLTAYLWPSSGTVTVLGERYGTVDVRSVRRRIGFVSSALLERVPARDTLSDVILSGRFASLGVWEDPSAADRARVRDITASVGLASLADQSYGVSSFGERQRALIGRALAADPAILILDEPCEGLDLPGRETVLDTLDRLASSPSPPTVLFVTHRIEELPRFTTHALVLREGVVVACGPASETVTGAVLSEAMGIPVEVLVRKGRRYAVVG